MSFRLEGEDGAARAGVLGTAHGEVPTPLFMPVATQGSVRTLSVTELEEAGVRALIANSYSLMLRPGVEAVEEIGGLHSFMRWKGVLFTDSGGFQMVRKGFLVRKDDAGVTFKDHVSGQLHTLTPEAVVEAQERLGADVAMVLDDCPPAMASYGEVEDATRRTTEWARRCLEAHGREDQQLFAITQGGVVPELRNRSSQELVDMGFEGYGIGGLSIGESLEDMWRTVSGSIHLIPADRPRYLMGVGSPRELLDAIALGVDVFDSAFPTRGGRHGTVLTGDGRFDITRGRVASDRRPLDPGCPCRVCQEVDRAYVHHLWRSKDMRWMNLLSFHNVALTERLMAGAREAVLEGRFEEFRKEWSMAGLSAQR